MTVATQMTADELLKLPRDGWRYELVRGELRKMSPSGFRHGRVAARIIVNMGAYVERYRLGVVCSSETGFRVSRNPDTVRAPDAAFVRGDRVVDTRGFFEGAPDVAFEVISPGDRYTEIEEKTLDWLRAGTRAVVIADPETRTIRVHRTNGVVNVVETLELDDVLPGWKMPLVEVFD